MTWHRAKFKVFAYSTGSVPVLMDTDKPGLVSDNGVWGIQLDYGWSVTHTPTGRRIGSFLGKLAKAKAFAAALDPLWPGWPTLTEGDLIPPEVAARVRELLTEARA